MIEYAIEGQEVSRICVDFAVALQTVDGVELRIETAFAVTASDNAPLLRVRADDLGEAGGQVLGLLRQRVALAVVHDSGRLELKFSGGGQLICEPDCEFEAWILTAPSGERVVCSPGGGTVRWPDGS